MGLLQNLGLSVWASLRVLKSLTSKLTLSKDGDRETSFCVFLSPLRLQLPVLLQVAKIIQSTQCFTDKENS